MIQTPMEVSGVETTWAQEEAFWADLAASSTRVRVTTIGNATGGRPVRLVGIGYPSAPPTPGVTPMSSMLVVGSQHGYEPAGREGAIHYARDMAFTTNPADLAYLTDHPVWIVPTANPSRVPSGVAQENIDGVDLNRDHVQLLAPETRAIHGVIRDLAPEIILDLHEGASTGQDANVGGLTHPATVPALLSASDGVVAGIRSYLTANGFANLGWSSSDQERLARQSAGLRHAVGILIETNMAEQQLPRRRDSQVASVRGAMSYHAGNTTAIRSANAASRVAAPMSPLFVSPTVTLDPAPTAYRLTAAQYEATAHIRAALGVRATVDGADYIVTRDQPGARLFVYAIDPDARWGTVSAQRVYPAAVDLMPGFEPSHWGPLRAGGVDCTVTDVSVMFDGQLLKVWPKS